MPNSRRAERVGRQIGQALSLIIERQAGDPRLRLITITGARVTADLRRARVFYSALGSAEDRKECGRALERALPFLRHEITKELQLRYSPELEVIYDNSLDRAERLDELLDSGARSNDGGGDDGA